MSDYCDCKCKWCLNQTEEHQPCPLWECEPLEEQP